jgi:hypothetical protein
MGLNFDLVILAGDEIFVRSLTAPCIARLLFFLRASLLGAYHRVGVDRVI